MPETLIPLSSARGIRLCCPCGAESTVPAGAINAPHLCFNCNAPFPHSAVKELTDLLKWVKESSASGKVKIELLLVGQDTKA